MAPTWSLASTVSAKARKVSSEGMAWSPLVRDDRLGSYPTYRLTVGIYRLKGGKSIGSNRELGLNRSDGNPGGTARQNQGFHRQNGETHVWRAWFCGDDDG